MSVSSGLLVFLPLLFLTVKCPELLIPDGEMWVGYMAVTCSLSTWAQRLLLLSFLLLRTELTFQNNFWRLGQLWTQLKRAFFSNWRFAFCLGKALLQLVAQFCNYPSITGETVKQRAFNAEPGKVQCSEFSLICSRGSAGSFYWEGLWFTRFSFCSVEIYISCFFPPWTSSLPPLRGRVS